jgi:probable rRNA maturation factor
MILVEFDLGPEKPVAAELAERAARAALDLSGAPDADLTLVLTGDERLRTLNHEFLGIDAPTDVLSFPADELDPETGRRYLGDVIISTARAAQQAGVGGHPLEAEIQLLVIHGVLHLLGHDHASVTEKARMWAVQAEALKHIGISAAILHE